MRWEILYEEGGVLVDADSVCVRPLDENLLDCEAFACWENEVARPGLIAAGYFGCNAGNEFVGKIISDIFNEDSVVNEMAWKTVGPKRLTESYRKYNYQSLRIFPSHFFIPEHFTGIAYNGSGPIYAYQEWASTRSSYDELYLKAVDQVGRSLREPTLAKNRVTEKAPPKSELNQPLKPTPLSRSISALHAPYFVQKINVNPGVIGLSRLEVFSELCQGKRVLHVGCADWPITDLKHSLHLELQPHCAKLDGMDTNEEALSLLEGHAQGNLFCRFEDIRDDYDLILAPEVMEHTSDVKGFLSQLGKLNAPLIVITVPDAYQCFGKHFEYSENSSTFTEIVHPDHNCWYTPYTLSNVIRKYTSWKILGIWFFNSISLMTIIQK
jgi:mannosyltransferase OCH1-like enzyme